VVDAAAGKVHAKTTALSHAGTDRNAAAKCLHDLVNQGQAQTHAGQTLVPHWFKPFEWLENARGICFRDALTSISHFEHMFVIFCFQPDRY
jgi:hypothetical protein